ncbi:hypothetical protein BC834DRAFT_856327 [Gloeopeniophorella convolvens]|nr:hypothetical protein BC834DRAFT_856327 [Gloeopeniophorella convolvens]
MLKQLDKLTKAEHYMATAQIQRGTAIVEREQRRQERTDASDARHEDTSMWLVRGKVYEAWKSSGTLLWITGKRISFNFILWTRVDLSL